MTDVAKSIATHLNGSGVKTRRAAGNYMAICPAHKDDTPSLAVRIGKNGKLMYRCHAGCTFSAIRTEIENRGFDAFTGLPLGSGSPTFVAEAGPQDPPELPYAPYEDPDWINQKDAFATIAGRSTERRHVYRDLDGHPLMTVTLTRLQSEKGKLQKVFLSSTPRLEDGKVVIKQQANPTPRLPYGAERMNREGPAFVIEGEKKADILNAILNDRYTVLSAYGANPEGLDLTALGDRDIVMVMDHDAPGLIQSFRYETVSRGRFAATNTPFAHGESFDIADLAEERDVSVSTLAISLRRHAKIEFAKTNFLKRLLAMIEAGRRIQVATTCEKTAEQILGHFSDSCRITLVRPEDGSAPTIQAGAPLFSRRSKNETIAAFTWFNSESAGAVIDIHGMEPTDEAFQSRAGFAAFLGIIVEKRTIQFRTLIDTSNHLQRLVNAVKNMDRDRRNEIARNDMSMG